MTAWIVWGLIAYALGFFVWGLYNLLMWAGSEGCPEERARYGRRVLATPWWPLALLREAIGLVGEIAADIEKYDEEKKEREQR